MVMALAERGFAAEVTMWPEGELDASLKNWDERPIVRVRLLPGAKPDSLFAQILKRHTAKSDFDTSRPVSGDVLSKVLASAGAERFGLKTGGTIDPARLDPLRQLCWESAQIELLTPRTVMESIALTRVGPAEILQHRDGISLNDLPVRMISAVGLFDRTQPPAKGSHRKLPFPRASSDSAPMPSRAAARYIPGTPSSQKRNQSIPANTSAAP
jgi:hypothetical protein